MNKIFCPISYFDTLFILLMLYCISYMQKQRGVYFEEIGYYHCVCFWKRRQAYWFSHWNRWWKCFTSILCNWRYSKTLLGWLYVSLFLFILCTLSNKANYITLLMNNKLNEHLYNIDTEYQNQFKFLMKQFAEKENITNICL